MPDPFPFSRSQRHVEFLFASRANLNISRCFQFYLFIYLFIFHHNLLCNGTPIYIEEVSIRKATVFYAFFQSSKISVSLEISLFC